MTHVRETRVDRWPLIIAFHWMQLTNDGCSRASFRGEDAAEESAHTACIHGFRSLLDGLTIR